MKFKTDFRYTDRETKANYVWLKYRPILEGKKILDVGSDRGYLRKHLDENASYFGIGIGEYVDQKIDLEREGLPFPDNSYDCVLCLDVLEHLENIHATFDELCRVSRCHVIISFPNPLGNIYTLLRFGDYRPGQFTKFYGLPVEPPPDRHRWFFTFEEAKKFIEYRAGLNEIRIAQLDPEWVRQPEGIWERLALKILLQKDFNTENLYSGPLWVVLEKK